MKNKSLADSSLEELNANKKTLVTIIIVLSVLILLYAGYFIFKLVTGTWEANNTLGTVGFGTLGVVTSLVSVQLSRVGIEIKNRNTGK
jgi:hypothetical protein